MHRLVSIQKDDTLNIAKMNENINIITSTMAGSVNDGS